MKDRELSEFTDQELLAEAKKMRWTALGHAFAIGFMFAVVVYSLVKNTWGLLTLIPLFFIYRLTRKSTRYDDLERILRERNLK